MRSLFIGATLALGAVVGTTLVSSVASSEEIKGAGYISKLLEDPAWCWLGQSVDLNNKPIPGFNQSEKPRHPNAKEIARFSLRAVNFENGVPFVSGRNHGGVTYRLVRVPCPPPSPAEYFGVTQTQSTATPLPVSFSTGEIRLPSGLYFDLHTGFLTGGGQWIESFPATSTDKFPVKGPAVGVGANFINVEDSGPGLGHALMFYGMGTSINLADIQGSTSVGCGAPCRTSSTWYATAYGQVGLQIGPVFPYIIGGAAFGDVRANVGTFPGASDVRVGWTGGFGVMVPAGPVVFDAKVQYIDLGSPHLCTPALCGGNANIKLSYEVATFGVLIPVIPTGH